MSTISSAVEKLRDPEYRKAFVASQINVGIPFQIRALLKARGKTQDWLARKTGMLQPRISGLMTPGKTHPNIETLRRVAEAFDCGLTVRFVPFTELAEWSERFDPEAFKIPDFDTEMALREDKEPEAAAMGQPLLGGSSRLRDLATAWAEAAHSRWPAYMDFDSERQGAFANYFLKGMMSQEMMGFTYDDIPVVSVTAPQMIDLTKETKNSADERVVPPPAKRGTDVVDISLYKNKPVRMDESLYAESKRSA